MFVLNTPKNPLSLLAVTDKWREREREREVNLVKDKGLAKAKRRRDADNGGGDEPQPSSGKRPQIVETKPSQPSNKMNLFRNGVSDEELLLELQAAVDQKVAALGKSCVNSVVELLNRFKDIYTRLKELEAKTESQKTNYSQRRLLERDQ
ncbi:hypothetical protein FEM48_ZijujUnG0007700 [Ziziphus jujuba var. spinosa]|uniref:Uncharacterized protein n=1 Tax=Ziziphus jujuba var. spinosa TaxID=714518 RepID=A0A978UA05_ZIZJJ|nr:hypothetical protein FEM48_ZijujUnG0007700 [Ziziphus jujuba var. spinosa]